MSRLINIISIVLIGAFGVLIIGMIPLSIGVRGGGGPVIVLGILWIAMVITFVISVLARGRRRAIVVLEYLEQALRLNLPLPRLLQSIGEAEGGRFGRDLDQCRVALEEGAPLAVVIGSVPRMPQRIVEMVAAAERVGHLPQVVSRMMQHRRDAMLNRVGRATFYRIYPWLVGAVLVSMLSVLMIFVMPKYEAIFKDFHTDLPWVTRATLWMARGWGPLIGFGFVVLCLVMLFSEFTLILNGRRLDDGASLASRLLNLLPGLRAIRMHPALGEVLDFAADSVELGHPLNISLTEATQITPNVQLRRRMAMWVDGINQGKTVSEAAQRAGMPSLVYGMIGSTMQSPDLAAALRFLGRYYRSRFSRTTILLQAGVVPIVALVMGFFVGWVALCMFLPIIRLIDQANPYIGGFRKW